MTIDIEPLKKELGRKIEDEDVITQAPIKAIIATFDRLEKVPAPGEPIAPGWHLCFLHSYARRNVLAEDGLPTEGGVLPKIPLPRRMYAGSTFTFDGDIRVGDKLRRETEFSDVQVRGGGTGTPLFSPAFTSSRNTVLATSVTARPHPAMCRGGAPSRPIR